MSHRSTRQADEGGKDGVKEGMSASDSDVSIIFDLSQSSRSTRRNKRRQRKEGKAKTMDLAKKT